MPNAREVNTFRELLALWPSDALAADLKLRFSRINGWRRTGRIPAEYWDGVIRSARRRGIAGVTHALLAGLPSARGAQSFAAVVALWPGFLDLARDLGVPESTVRSWHRRDSLPIGYWPSLVSSAHRRGIRHLTHSKLQGIAIAHSTQTRRCKMQRRSPPAECVTDACRIAQDATTAAPPIMLAKGP